MGSFFITSGKWTVMYLSFRGIDVFACWVMELFRQCGIVCFACQICLNCSNSVFFSHYISLFYIFFSLVYICVYFRIIASSSNFSFHFVVSACDFQFVFTPTCFVGFMFYLLFALFFWYTVFFWSSFAESLIKINSITFKIRSKVDFKSKSQNIW